MAIDRVLKKDVLQKSDDEKMSKKRQMPLMDWKGKTKSKE